MANAPSATLTDQNRHGVEQIGCFGGTEIIGEALYVEALAPRANLLPTGRRIRLADLQGAGSEMHVREWNSPFGQT